mmetsp:Transcript_28500/g.40836  ORF Transcript_28500/g.40836 Transcript_28500/m.40836 type:complete len:562 (-) Transcript_28500:33-1718(-)
MTTPPQTLIIRPKARKFEELALEEMRKQQLLISKSKRKQIAPESSSSLLEQAQDDADNCRMDLKVLDAETPEGTLSFDTPALTKNDSKENTTPATGVHTTESGENNYSTNANILLCENYDDAGSASLSLSDDDELQHHRVRKHASHRTTIETVAPQIVQKSNTRKYRANATVKNDSSITRKNKSLRSEDRLLSNSSPGLNNSSAPLVQDLCYDFSEKYISSDTDYDHEQLDNDDASTITRSSGGNEASSEADDIADSDDGNDEDNYDAEEEVNYGEDLQNDNKDVVQNISEGNHLQQAFKRLAFLSRSAQNSLSHSIIKRSWFSSDINVCNTPTPSLPQSRFGSGSFAGDSDSLKYSSVDSFASTNGVHRPGVINTTNKNNNVVSSVLSNGVFQDGTQNVMARETEKHHNMSSPVPPNLPRSKNRSSSQGELGELSAQPKYIVVGHRKKGGYESFESPNDRFSQSEKSKLLNTENGKKFGSEIYGSTDLIRSSIDTFNVPVDNGARFDEEIGNVDADIISIDHGVYTFHTYFWRGVIVMSSACLFFFLLLFVLENLGFFKL